MGKALLMALRPVSLQISRRLPQLRHLDCVPPSCHKSLPILRMPIAYSYVHLRSASTTQAALADARSLGTRMKNLLLGTTLGLVIISGYFYVTDTRSIVLHQWAVLPSLRWIYDDAEDAHEAGNKSLKTLYQFGLHPRERGNPDGAGDLTVEVARKYFPPKHFKYQLHPAKSVLGLRPHPLKSNRY